MDDALFPKSVTAKAFRGAFPEDRGTGRGSTTDPHADPACDWEVIGQTIQELPDPAAYRLGRSLDDWLAECNEMIEKLNAGHGSGGQLLEDPQPLPMDVQNGSGSAEPGSQLKLPKSADATDAENGSEKLPPAAVESYQGGKSLHYLIHESYPSTAENVERLGPDQGDQHPLIDPTSDPVERRAIRYTVAKQRSTRMADYLRGQVWHDRVKSGGLDVGHIAEKLSTCGDLITFEDYTGSGIEETRICEARFCQQFRMCPLCAIRRAARWLREVSPKLQQTCMQVLADHPGSVLVNVTYTVKNGRSLADRLGHLLEHFRAAFEHRRKYLSYMRTGRGRHRAYTELSLVLGAIYAIEIKRGGRSGGWHPHLHAVMLCERMPSEDRLRDEWHERTGDSHQIKVQRFRSMDFLTRPDRHSASMIEDALAKDLREVGKYPLKFSDIALADNWRIERVVRAMNVRLRQSYGALRGMDRVSELLDTSLDMTDVPYVLRVAEWMGDEYRITEEGEYVR